MRAKLFRGAQASRRTHAAFDASGETPEAAGGTPALPGNKRAWFDIGSRCFSSTRDGSLIPPRSAAADRYCPSNHAKINGATMVASDSMMNLGVSTASLPQVIFSLGMAPE